MKTNEMLAAASFLFLALAGSSVAHAGERGQVQVKAAAKAVVAGPTTIHAVSQYSGGQVFVVDATNGGDADCAAAANKTSSSALEADRTQTVTARAGQVICVASNGARTIELLWHAQKDAPAPTTYLAKR
jgi:hypothetical protein